MHNGSGSCTKVPLVLFLRLYVLTQGSYVNIKIFFLLTVLSYPLLKENSENSLITKIKYLTDFLLQYAEAIIFEPGGQLAFISQVQRKQVVHLSTTSFLSTVYFLILWVTSDYIFKWGNYTWQKYPPSIPLEP